MNLAVWSDSFGMNGVSVWSFKNPTTLNYVSKYLCIFKENKTDT